MRSCQKQPPVVKWHVAGWDRTRPVLRLLLILIAATVPKPQTASSQIIPLEDMAPIAELEIRTDDLIRIATSYVDAVREMKTAQLSVKTLQSLRPNANITGLEMQIADINLKAAENKVRILRAIAEKTLAMAQAKLSFLERMEQGGAPTPEGVLPSPSQVNPRLAQAKFTVEILRMILEME